MHKIAVMGDRDSIFGFASLGMHIFPVDEPSEAAPMLHKMAESGYAVIFITEALASGLENELERYRTRPLPAIVPIPGVKGNTGMEECQQLRTKGGRLGHSGQIMTLD